MLIRPSVLFLRLSIGTSLEVQYELQKFGITPAILPIGDGSRIEVQEHRKYLEELRQQAQRGEREETDANDNPVASGHDVSKHATVSSIEEDTANRRSCPTDRHVESIGPNDGKDPIACVLFSEVGH